MFNIKSWLGGYVRVNLKGYNQERFVNICNGHDIVIHKINCTKDGYTGYMLLKDYRCLRPISRKTGVLPYIIQRKGFPFIIDYLKKHISLPIAVALFFTIILYLGTFIWNIEVTGGHVHTEPQITECLKNIDVMPGAKAEGINCKEIEDYIRNTYPDIGWVSAELNGTCLKIKLNEINQPVDYSKKKKKASHIVAVKEGTVVSIVTRAGTPLVKTGDTVKPGDILVSGIIDLHDDSGNVTEKYSVIADADISIKTVYNYSDKVPMLYKTKVYTGEYEHWYEFWLLNNKIISYNYGNSYTKYDIITEVNKVHIFEDYYLPFGYASVFKREYIEKYAYYSISQCMEIASDNLGEFINRINAGGGTILSNTVKAKLQEDCIQNKGKITAAEPAWEYVKIKDEELEMNKPDEH